MADETLNTQAAVPAQESENTAVSETEHTETPEGESLENAESKTFTQEELDAKIGERLAKERRKWEREQRERAETHRPEAKSQPTPDQFKTVEEYVEALTDYKAQQKIAEREQMERQKTVRSSYENRAEEAREKYDDFEQVAHGDHVKITPEMAETIMASEIGPEIAYYLGSNPSEASKIANLSPLQQAREIGKIEASLTANPPAKKASSAPAPIKPVGARSSTPKVAPSDSRSDKAMSDAEWIAARNAQIAKNYRS